MKLEGSASHENDGNGILLQSRRSSEVRVQIMQAKPKTITHLPKRPPVDLAFSDLTYKVREGRKSSKYIYLCYLNFILFVYFSLRIRYKCFYFLSLTISQTLSINLLYRRQLHNRFSSSSPKNNYSRE